MLGDSDDLASVLSVLDRLSTELESNRKALDNTCKQADDLGGGADLPSGIVGEESIEELRREVAQENRNCAYLREALETAATFAASSVMQLRCINDEQVKREIKLHKTASQELLEWQNAVEKSKDEYTDLVTRCTEIDKALAKLYEKLQFLV